MHNLLGLENQNTLLRHPKLGASWEGFAMEEIIRVHHADPSNCYFWSTHAEAELDLMLFVKGQRLGFEFKYADAPRLTKSMQIACADLGLDNLYVIYPGDRSYRLSEQIQTISLTEYLKQITPK